ncbi:MAG: bifunctional oligoribonuclease/PAP phosphatase NrnA [Eubacteriales bacterium]|jgi:phosphoesterase RecJ-like protein|nr:bifunctional oligoribonuclease/PAP phosphatase NrnA [Lachnospiraceae bacterium]MDD5859700.1 bifunctional oligoribonuclease/PAP phosphatase NrnA [Eubacteriales bacterium]MCH4064308.1 bifunctional oligoribonuclease/PAP phosphatase NrnA [Lachnospiraceae bacterium]MCH4102967.1 bifunctional oligoribonuclease/PAP phosphatase NrnA [Lachnospiraceae bacterium]MCI1308956.1 bifunctional oligoribonuclease/PAP phosphatase NrnA [Lachnospiraceae bacterium]
MENISELLTDEIRTIGIAGHVNPDGDCVGSTTALRNYIRTNYPQYQVDLYLERPKDALLFLDGAKEAFREVPEEKTEPYDLFIICDVSTEDRIGVARTLFERARRTACIDHHLTNGGFSDIDHIEPDASSTAEVLANLMDDDKIDKKVATSLYTGMIHDTGVFQYSNTSPRTLTTAARLIAKGIPFSRIIDDSFNRRTYVQNRVLGYALEKAVLAMDGRVITCILTEQEMKRFGAERQDLDSIVAQLRFTEGAEAAVFIYETGKTDDGCPVFKVSFRSNEYLDVAALASEFGGGGHVRAAGCTMYGDPEVSLGKILDAVRPHLR